MYTKTLEFRGIPADHIVQYFEELDGVIVTTASPIILRGDSWSCKIMSEETIKITSTFEVNSIKVCFESETVEGLEDIIKRFRKKTVRVGG